MPDPEYPLWNDDRYHLTWNMAGLRWDRPLPSYITNPPNIQQWKGVTSMASNELPKGLEDLAAVGADALDGANQLEVIVGLKQNTKLLIEADLNAFNDACGDFEDAVVPVRDANAERRSKRSNARGFLTLGRDLLKPTLGNKPSAEWASAGWNDNSLAVPNDEEELLQMLLSQKNYLTTNPAREVAAVNYTAAKAELHRTALQTARAAANTAEDARKTAMNTRELCEAALRRRLAGLLAELAQLLDPMSPHWITFGFHQPGAPEVPDKVQGLQLTAQGNGSVRARWQTAPRAAHYQVHTKSDAPDAEFALLDSTTENDRTFDNLPVGVLQFKVRGVNETGEGKFSNPVTVTVT